jgi:hypothetical protein
MSGHSAYPWSIAVWRQHPAYIELMPREQGMTRNLLDEAVLRGGVLPDDERLLSRACGDPIEWPDARERVLRWWTKTNQGWTHPISDRAIAELESIGLQDALKNQRNVRAYEARKKRRQGSGIGAESARKSPTTPVLSVVGGSEYQGTNGNERLLEPIQLYNGVFGTDIGATPGNLRASERAFQFGYTLAQMETVFRAVKGQQTDAATWCWNHKREFEYLVRPEYRHNRTGELIPGRIDAILNELATGAKAR